MIIRDTQNGVTFFHEGECDAIKIGIMLEKFKSANINYTLKMENDKIRGIELSENDLVNMLIK